MDTIEECLLCRRPIDAALDPNDDTYLVHCECSGRYRVSMEDYRGRVQLPREDAALAARFAHALYMQGESEPTFDFGFGGSIPGAINAADLHAWNAHRRPSEGDEGKRVWVWEHPGSDLSQIRTGILASWDDSDLKMKDGKMCPWPTLYDWGFGDPPETVDR